MSVNKKTTGHSMTPAERLKPRPSTPRMVMSNGLNPNVDSSENILPPINSATNAFVIKKPESIKKRLVGLFSKSLFNF